MSTNWWQFDPRAPARRRLIFHICRAIPIGLVYGLITMNIVRGLLLAVLWGGVVAGLEEYRRARPPAGS